MGITRRKMMSVASVAGATAVLQSEGQAAVQDAGGLKGPVGDLEWRRVPADHFARAAVLIRHSEGDNMAYYSSNDVAAAADDGYQIRGLYLKTPAGKERSTDLLMVYVMKEAGAALPGDLIVIAMGWVGLEGANVGAWLYADVTATFFEGQQNTQTIVIPARQLNDTNSIAVLLNLATAGVFGDLLKVTRSDDGKALLFHVTKP